MKTILMTIGLVLGGQLLYSQPGIPLRNGNCVKTKSLTRSDLEKTHPFDKATKIQLVSFKPDLANESPPMKNGMIDTTKFIETKTLNTKEESSLIDILYNYNFDPKISPDSIDLIVRNCYMPRNAVIFRDKANEIITYLEICLNVFDTRILRKNSILFFVRTNMTDLRTISDNWG